MNNYSEEFNWGSFLCRITGIGTSDPKTKILIILTINYGKKTNET